METTRLYDLFLAASCVTTDSRDIQPGALFFALRGERFNGNQYALQSLRNGAAYAIVDDPDAIKGEDGRLIFVEDSLRALQALATHHRRQFGIPVIGITGSNGKTTTKELVRAVLAMRYRVHYTKGNFNNHIGVPLTLLAMPADTQIAIIEMGANHVGEIDSLCHIAEPDHGLVTNVGKAHLEGFGGFAGVVKAKGELYRYLAMRGGVAFVNREESHLSDLAAPCRNTVGYAGHIGKTTRLRESRPFLELDMETQNGTIRVRTRLVGAYNYPNALTAISLGRYFNVPDGQIIAGLENYLPQNNRSQQIRKGTNTIILDAYNANPTSMKAALDNFLHLPHPNDKKWAILGDMLELGPQSAAEHECILAFLQQEGFGNVITVGEEFQRVNKGNAYPDIAALAADWDWAAYDGAAFLMKGSRGIRLERLLE